MSESQDLDQFNADELLPPRWLNADFIGDILREYEKSPELKVTELKISPATAQGDHYASIMFRTLVEYSSSKGKHSKPLIVKTMPEQEGHKKDMLSDSHMFATEIGMYCHVLPEFERVLREAGDNAKLHAVCIYHSLEPREVMIFEDLVPQGYSVVRNRPVNESELKLVFAKLAKWHAVSMKLLNERPDFLKEFKYGVFDLPTFDSDPFITTGMASFIEMLDATPDLKKYKPHFEKVLDYYLKKTEEELKEYSTNRQSDAYYVLCHGDFHLRNMMFKDTGTLKDAMLVDFQFCNLTPIFVDLTYSIYMLMEPEQRASLGHDLINYYLTNLVDTLQKIGFRGQMPTQDKLWREIHKGKYYHFFMISTLLPLMVAVKSNSLKIHDLLQDADIRKKSYQLDIYVNDVRRILAKYEELGYFNEL
ncbi:hypothetical protein KR067_009619 [Drosophila pandora]|nr:hypothetical protein KR067_009619 [Drosophila pandora]